MKLTIRPSFLRWLISNLSLFCIWLVSFSFNRSWEWNEISLYYSSTKLHSKLSISDHFWDPNWFFKMICTCSQRSPDGALDLGWDIPNHQRSWLLTHLLNSFWLIYTPDKIRIWRSTASFARQYSRFTSSAIYEARSVEDDKCGQILAASSFPSHLETQNKIFLVAVLGEEYLDDHPVQIFRAH